MIQFNYKLFLKSAALAYAIFALSTFSFQSHATERLPSMQQAKIKEALIYNFLKLTQWPEKENNQNSNNLKICLLGDDPFNALLNDLNGRTAQRRPISIELRKNPYFVNDCDLAFISNTQEADLEGILKAIHGKPILTVSDIQGFSRKGGMIEMGQNSDEKIYLNINAQAVEKTDLRIKDDLLKMAEMIWVK